MGLLPIVLRAYEQVENSLDSLLHRYTRAALPRPENPDAFSIKAAKDQNLDETTVPGIGLSSDSKENEFISSLPLTKLFKKDFQAVCNKFAVAGIGLNHQIRSIVKNLIDFEHGIPVARLPGETGNHFHGSSGSTLNVPSTIEGPTNLIELYIPSDGDAVQVLEESFSTATPSPQLSANEDEDAAISEPEMHTVQIRTRAGSTDTLHMNVEVNGAVPGAPTYTGSFSASPRPTLVESVFVHVVDGESLRPYDDI